MPVMIALILSRLLVIKLTVLLALQSCDSGRDEGDEMGGSKGGKNRKDRHLYGHL